MPPGLTLETKVIPMTRKTDSGRAGLPRRTANLARPVQLAVLGAALVAWSLVAIAQPGHGSDTVLQRAMRSGLRPSLLPVGSAAPQWSLLERMARHKVPGVAVALVRNGVVVAAEGFGVRTAGTQDSVDENTLFNVGSVSKIVTAVTALRLVAAGTMELDRDINHYLTTWKVPPLPASPRAVVTLRMLLSHTSGLSVSGFADFAPIGAVPTMLQTLNGEAPAKNEPIRLLRAPGLLNEYSGGGFTVAQFAIESVMRQQLQEVTLRQVFEPVGMRRSTFSDPAAGTLNIAKAHDANGEVTAAPRGWERFPQDGASGLWTTANDLAAFVGAILRSYRGSGTLLPKSTAVAMLTEVSPSWHGLGPRLDGAGMTRVFHHGGSNDSYHAWIEGYPETGDGFVVLTNGANGARLRTEIRNALSDAIGHGVNPPLRTIALDPSTVRLADFAGEYRLDTNIPVDLRRSLTDGMNFATVRIVRAAEQLSVVLPDETGALLPLTPSRFVAPTVFGTQMEFHRDPHGLVRAMTVERGAARAYYRRVRGS